MCMASAAVTVSPVSMSVVVLVEHQTHTGREGGAKGREEKER